MTFWYGSGSADPCLWLMDPDPAIFVIERQNANKKLFCLFLFEGTFTSFFRDKKSKSHKTVGIKVAYYFCLMNERSGSGSRTGSVPLTNGSGTRRPENIRIRQVRIRIRNHNTDENII